VSQSCQHIYCPRLDRRSRSPPEPAPLPRPPTAFLGMAAPAFAWPSHTCRPPHSAVTACVRPSRHLQQDRLLKKGGTTGLGWYALCTPFNKGASLPASAEAAFRWPELVELLWRNAYGLLPHRQLCVLLSTVGASKQRHHIFQARFQLAMATKHVLLRKTGAGGTQPVDGSNDAPRGSDYRTLLSETLLNQHSAFSLPRHLLRLLPVFGDRGLRLGRHFLHACTNKMLSGLDHTSRRALSRGSIETCFFHNRLRRGHSGGSRHPNHHVNCGSYGRHKICPSPPPLFSPNPTLALADSPARQISTKDGQTALHRLEGGGLPISLLEACRRKLNPEPGCVWGYM